MRTRKQDSSQSSILAHQKLKRKKKHALRLRKWLLYSLGSTLVAVGTFYVYTKVKTFLHTTQIFDQQAESWQVQVSIEPTIKDKAKISRDLETLLTKESQSKGYRPEALAAKIKSQYPVEHVRIIQSNAQQLYVKLRFYVPFMKVEVDRLRYANNEGHILGNTDKMVDSLFAVGDMPVLSGIFTEGKRTFTTHAQDNTLEILDDERKLVLSAIDLLEQLKAKRLFPSHVRYIKHRGFSIVRKDESTEILLGTPPFPAKIEQLQKVLADLQKRHVQASRIELDYDGKAFIKEKSTL